MKPINLCTFVSAKINLTEQNFSNYLSLFGLKLAKKGDNEGIKPHELVTLESFVNKIRDEIQTDYDDISYFLLDEFYLGYMIPQIGKEFDLLRFGVDCVINIEIKKTGDRNKLLNQLIKNNYYLSFLQEHLFLFSYVADTKKLYRLVDKDLRDVEFVELCKLLNDQKTKSHNCIDNLFNPSDFLVSPFNSTEKFINNRYFLTDHQCTIKEEIFANFKKKIKFFSVTGTAGTGKTLLIYDIAKQAISDGLKAMVIHCGGLNEGHNKLINDYDWEIYKPKDALINDFSQYDVIIIDEAQRIYKDQLEKIIEIINKNKNKCIFSYDSKQCLSSSEIQNKNDVRINEICSGYQYSLTTKIRTNKIVASFIKKLLDRGNKDDIKSYQNIEIYYCKTVDEVLNISKLLETKHWQVINYTPGIRSFFHYEKYKTDETVCSHSVIGQEFDNVAVVIDNNFTYVGNKLAIKGLYKEYYSQRQMLFQNLTRTRKKLCIIIFNNEEILERCNQILCNI